MPCSNSLSTPYLSRQDIQFKQEVFMNSEKIKGLSPVLVVFFSVAVILILLLVACSQATPASSPSSSTPAPSTEVTPQIKGKDIYTQKCAVCHGPDADGTSAAPAVAGHSISTTKTQVRNPMGTMPAFSPDQLSDEELDEIAEFISGMGMAKVPIQDWEKQTTEAIHDWMALIAIKDGDAADAKHHLQDALAFIKEPMHKTETEKALNLIAQGNMHDAEHEIEEMAGAESPSGITMRRFHLLLAQRSVEAENATEVKHHLEHFLVKATADEEGIVQEALELIEKDDFHEAAHEIEELLGM